PPIEEFKPGEVGSETSGSGGEGLNTGGSTVPGGDANTKPAGTETASMPPIEEFKPGDVGSETSGAEEAKTASISPFTPPETGMGTGGGPGSSGTGGQNGIPELSSEAPEGVEMAEDGTLLGSDGAPLAKGPGDTSVAPDGTLLGSDGTPLQHTAEGWENPVTGEMFDENGNLVETASTDTGDLAAADAGTLPDGVHVDPETGELVGDDGQELPRDPKTDLPMVDGKLLDPLTGQELAFDPKTGMQVDPTTGALIDPETGDFLDPDDPTKKLAEDEERGLVAHADTGVMTDPTTGLHFNEDGQLTDVNGKLLEIDDATGKPVDAVTGELLGEDGRLLDATGKKPLDIDPSTGLPVDDATGQLIDPHSGQRFDPTTLAAVTGAPVAGATGPTGSSVSAEQVSSDTGPDDGQYGSSTTEPHVIEFEENGTSVTVEVDSDSEVTIDIAGDGGTHTVAVEDGEITVDGTVQSQAGESDETPPENEPTELPAPGEPHPLPTPIGSGTASV
ncbi:MAG: hypothetical protein ACRCYR_11845, partial [Phycicoccus sp.]